MGNVVINGRTAVHAGSGGTVTSPDICKTPRRCRPVTYNNVAKSSDAAKTASSVIINGHPACNRDSIFAVSSGDEPGSCGGVRSGTIKGKAEFVTASPNVFIEGKPAVRQGDLMTSNNRNTPPMPLMQPGAGKPPDIRPQRAEGLAGSERANEIPVDIKGEQLDLLKSLLVADDGKEQE